MRRILSPRNILIFLVALVALVYYGSYVFTDYLWFAGQGYQSVFITTILAKIGVAVAAALATFAFVLGNLLVARREGPPQPLDIYTGDDSAQFHINPSTVTIVTFVGAGVIALLAASWGAGNWSVVLQFLHPSAFGLSDPFFNRDVGFYVFSLPFWRTLYGGAMAVLVLTLVAVTVYYLANRGVDFRRYRPQLSTRTSRHLALLAAAILFLKAGGYYIARLNLLYSPRGVAFGASYTDIHAQLPVLRILMVVAAAVALVVIYCGWSRRGTLAVYGLGFMVAASLVLGTAYPAFIQQFTVEPDEISKETPYILKNISFTRAAFDLNRVAEREFPVSNDLTLKDIQEDSASIQNVRLWDWRPLRDSYGQLQAIRLYYDFADVDLDRYTIDGRYRQVTIAARELNHDLLPTEARTWMNDHLKYTHGYGVVLSPTASVTSEGMPSFYVRDIPPVTTTPSIKVTRPEIYFGELTNDYAIVNTTAQEFDYPVGDQNQYANYAGKGGIQLSNPVIRGAFALRLRSYQTLLANSITKDTRVMIYRNIHQLVRKLAPFLRYDSDPYIVIGDDGRLLFIQDAYTVTNLYPYSERASEGMNYIRNSVKISIDAYSGEVNYYLWDDTDPLAQTLAKIFPALFKPASEMPADVRAHVRYPEDLFSIQAEMYATYHMQDAQVFYNKEDVYQRPVQLYTDAERPQLKNPYQGQAVEPHYMIIRLPGEAKAELVQMLPFNPKEKSNMIAWLAARSDGESYGDLVVFKFPKNQLVYGPMQIEARIDQDTTISQNLTLWSQAGSMVIRGTLLVIPIKNSILYVEPLYLQASGNKLPELKRVIVAYGDRVVMTESLTTSLETIFGAGVNVGPGPGPGPGITPGTPEQTDRQRVAELGKRANGLFVSANEAARRGDWAAYGEFIKQLGQVLNELERASGAANTGAGGSGTPGGAGGAGPGA